MTTTLAPPPREAARWTQVAWLAGITAALVAVPGGAEAGPFPSAYRILFITADESDATSTNPATYDTFVTDQANQVGSSAPQGTSWSAVISTAPDQANPSGVAANVHVSCGVSCDASVPIYTVDGRLLANSTNDLFNGSVQAVPVDQFKDYPGGVYATAYVWTGSTSSGALKAGLGAGTTNPGGLAPTPGLTELGDPYWPAGFIDANMSDNNSYFNVYLGDGYYNSYHLYGISSVIMVPEPATGGAIMLGGLAVTRVLRRRRRQ